MFDEYECLWMNLNNMMNLRITILNESHQKKEGVPFIIFIYKILKNANYCIVTNIDQQLDGYEEGKRESNRWNFQGAHGKF